MIEERPLHVRVAEALGWTEIEHDAEGRYNPGYNLDALGLWGGLSPRPTPFSSGGECRLYEYIPRYDTDWSATGPLIERFRIYLEPSSPRRGDDGRGNTYRDYDWGARQYRDQKPWVGHGETPLVAVCSLIVALHIAGKLEV